MWTKLALEDGKCILIQGISASYRYDLILTPRISLVVRPSQQTCFHLPTMKFKWNNNREAKTGGIFNHCICRGSNILSGSFGQNLLLLMNYNFFHECPGFRT